jgi:hypothetical protein
MPLDTAPLLIGTQAWWIRDGQAITVPSAGTASATNKPGATEPTWISIGDIESSSEGITGDEKKVFAPAPGHLELLKRVVTKAERKLKFTTVSYGPFAIELTKQTAPLTAASTTFTPMAETVKRGWLKVQRRNEADGIVTTEILWGSIAADGEASFGDDYAKPSFVFTQEKNSLSGGTILT